MNIAELEIKTLVELQDIARTLGVTGYTRLKKIRPDYALVEGRHRGAKG